MATTAPRQTAGERRIAVLEAANVEFALRGLHGASTDAIARRAGISQPYLFRLFGSKKELFIAVIEDCFARTLESFRAAASGSPGAAALARDRPTRMPSRSRDDQHDAPGPAAVVRRLGRGRRHPRGHGARLRPARRLRRDRLRRRSRHDRAVLREGDAHERAGRDAVLDRERDRTTPGPSAWPRAARRTSHEGASLFSPNAE